MCKAVGLQGVQFPSGNWVAPTGSYRSGGGGNETVGAFETNASLWRCSEQAGPRFSGKKTKTKFEPQVPRVGGDRAGHARSDPAEIVSIHAPAWGATTSRRNRPDHGLNPRPRVGGDPGCGGWISDDKVSIHAPAWGATADWRGR